MKNMLRAAATAAVLAVAASPASALQTFYIEWDQVFGDDGAFATATLTVPDKNVSTLLSDKLTSSQNLTLIESFDFQLFNADFTPSTLSKSDLTGLKFQLNNPSADTSENLADGSRGDPALGDFNFFTELGINGCESSLLCIGDEDRGGPGGDGPGGDGPGGEDEETVFCETGQILLDGVCIQFFSAARNATAPFSLQVGYASTTPGPRSGASEVPLPAAGWLLLAGIGGIAALRRRA